MRPAYRSERDSEKGLNVQGLIAEEAGAHGDGDAGDLGDVVAMVRVHDGEAFEGLKSLDFHEVRTVADDDPPDVRERCGRSAELCHPRRAPCRTPRPRRVREFPSLGHVVDLLLDRLR